MKGVRNRGERISSTIGGRNWGEFEVGNQCHRRRRNLGFGFDFQGLREIEGLKVDWEIGDCGLEDE